MRGRAYHFEYRLWRSHRRISRSRNSGFATGIDDDMPIWADKIYQANPVLCDGDGPINKHRKFFSQFYS